MFGGALMASASGNGRPAAFFHRFFRALLLNAQSLPPAFPGAYRPGCAVSAHPVRLCKFLKYKWYSGIWP